MSTVVHCSNCGAPVRPGSPTCHYCHAVIILPAGAGNANVAGSAVAGVPAGVVEALRKGNKIDAIRVYREATKSSLLDAKNTVEALEKKLGLN